MLIQQQYTHPTSWENIQIFPANMQNPQDELEAMKADRTKEKGFNDKIK